MAQLSIDFAKTALVVIDLQKGIVGMTTAPYTSAVVVSNTAKIAAACRARQMPVFLVHVTGSADGKDRLAPNADSTMPVRSPMPADWADIVPELGPESSDFIITKRQWGAFYGTDLELQLRRRGITQIIVTGIATNIGVESTARFAFEYGFEQIFVEDAMASMSGEAHDMSVKTIFPRMGRVRTTDEVMAALQ